MPKLRETVVARGKYAGCTMVVVDKMAVRMLSDAEISKFKADVERRIANPTFCPVCDQSTNAACAHSLEALILADRRTAGESR